MSKLTTISGYVPTRPFNELDSDRYEYLTLDQAEPNPGLPDSDYSLFTSMKSGERRFTTDPRLSGLSFKGDTLEQIPTSNPTYFLVLKNLPGSGLVNGLDDSVAWSLGEIEEQDTLQTVTDRGNVTTQGITVNDLTTVANASIGTNLEVGGNLTVNGTTTTLNTSELTVDDINIQIADGAPDAATADGAGITVDGANATMTYVAATDRWSFNKDLDIENQYVAGNINLDGTGNQSIVNTNGVLDITSPTVQLQSSLTNVTDAAGSAVFASFQSGAIALNEILTVSDSANLQGEIRATNVPETSGIVKTLFRRQSDGLIMEGEVEEVEVDKVFLAPTNVDSALFIMFSEANGGTSGFDSAEFDLDLTYNPGTNTLTLQNITATGLSDLDSTNVAGDLQLNTLNSSGETSSGRLLDSAGRSFVIYDSSGNLLWGNNGTSAGNLGGPQAVNLNLEDLANVNITNVQNGQVIKWDAVASEWINANDLEGAGGSGIALTDLSVTQNAPSGTGSLSYNNLNGVFTYTPPALPDITNISLDDLVNVDAVGDVSNNTYVLKSDGDGSFSLAAQSGGGGGGNAFTTIASTGQSNITASSATDTLNIEGSASIGVTTTPGTNTVTISYTGSATGLASRGSINNTTGTIANDGSADLTISNGFETYALLKIETSHAAWVRLYVDTASRTADASRVITDDPAPDAGVIAEVITTGAETIKMSPGVIGWLESGTDIPVRVTNKSGGNAAVQVTLTLVQLEA